jgi:DNA-binding Lrp family transcriptional regulator
MEDIELNNADQKIVTALGSGRNTPSNLAEELGYSREYVSQRLKRLREHDIVQRVGRGLYELPNDDAGEIKDDVDTALSPTPEPEPEPIDGGGDDLLDELREFLGAEGRPPKTDHGRGAVVDIVAYLREHGTAATGDLKAAVYPSYDDEWGSERVMWESVRRYFDDVPGIEKAGYGKYEYAGDEAVREAIEGDSGANSGPYDPTEEF